MISFLILLAIVVCFSAILALALNLQWGLGGMVNFGLAGFYTLGAYTCALLILKGGANTFVATLGAMAMVAAACALTALVTLRVTEEDYFAIVTLGVGEMLRLASLNEDWLTKGALGLSGIPRPLDHVIPHDVYVYFLLGLSVALLLATLAVLNVLARAPFGRIVRALREDDVVAATLGKNVLWARVRVFAIGGAFIGLAGSLHAFYYQYIDPTQFTNLVIAYAFMERHWELVTKRLSSAVTADIALIQLERSFRPTTNIKPVPLASRNDTALMAPGPRQQAHHVPHYGAHCGPTPASRNRA